MNREIQIIGVALIVTAVTNLGTISLLKAGGHLTAIESNAAHFQSNISSLSAEIPAYEQYIDIMRDEIVYNTFADGSSDYEIILDLERKLMQRKIQLKKEMFEYKRAALGI